MIPKRMEKFLKERITEPTWDSRLIKENGRCYLEFTAQDIDRLNRLGIAPDALGPQMVVCMWDEAAPYEVGGYLVVDNLTMGLQSMGGVRILPDITPAVVYSLARGMTLKNTAAGLPFGGGKAGIVADRSLTPQRHTHVIQRFARLLYRYHHVFIPGPDVGTDDADMKTIAIMSGLDNAVSKPVEMGGNRVDQLGAGAGGAIIALQTLLGEMDRLRGLPQFAQLKVPAPDQVTVIIQGFGAFGAHAARLLDERLPGARVVGISDALGYLYDRGGLPVSELYKLWTEHRSVTQLYYREHIQPADRSAFHKYSNAPDDLLRESAFCLIPASPAANYLDIGSESLPSMTVRSMGDWAVIIEGANTYSPDPHRRAARRRMERAVYRDRGVLIATDYLVNSGGVIFAAQERMIKTPSNLRIPEGMLGDRNAVEGWLQEHAEELAGLAEKRRLAGESQREQVIRRNMVEFIDLLAADTELLPCEAAEQISIRRIMARERNRLASDVMAPIPTISQDSSVRQAAQELVAAGCPILAVVDSKGGLVGVVTEWDITRATAQAAPDDLPLTGVMSKEVVSVEPTANLIEVIQKFEHFEVSALPVVDDGQVLGMVNSELLARKSLLRLLQS